jgi:outer membrane protein OmpA-like peptidoglycan-associated protein
MQVFTLTRQLLRPTAIGLAISMAFSGCATIDRNLGNSSGGTACAAGGVAGAVIGAGLAAALGKDVGGGALAGAAIGCGATMLYQTRVKRLQDVAREEGLAMQVRELQLATPATRGTSAQVATVGLEAQLQVGEMFPVGSAQLTAEGLQKARKIASALADNQKGKATPGRKILVVGHTDATGTAELNQRLSEQRARAMGQVLASAGIAANDIYYQGAGASRPLADNATSDGRAENRRVEMTEVDSQQLLIERVRSERNNPRYLAQGTRSNVDSTAKAVVKPAAKATATAKAEKLPNPPVESGTFVTPPIALDGKGFIDFGGHPATNTQSMVAQGIKPKSSGFDFISPAYAAVPIRACVADMPRLTGDVKSLATDAPLSTVQTNDYLPGMNGRPWGGVLNGNVALVGPVSILREDARVVQQPFMQFIANYKAATKKETEKFQAVANTYEGEDKILYRVFAAEPGLAPVACMDIVFDKRTGAASAGELFYSRQGQAYVTAFQPVRR